MYPPGDRGTIDFTHLVMEILSIEEEEEEVDEEESGYQEDKQIDLKEGLLERLVKIILQDPNNQPPQIDLHLLDKKMSGLSPLLLREEMMQ